MTDREKHLLAALAEMADSAIDVPPDKNHPAWPTAERRLMAALDLADQELKAA